MAIAQWSRQFFMQIETGDNTVGTPDGSDLLNNLPTLLAAANPGFGATDIGMEGDGVAGGLHKLLLSDTPSIMPSTAVQDSRKTTGTADPSEKDIEVTIAEPPETELPMNMSSYACNMGLLLLFQQGSTQAYVESLKTEESCLLNNAALDNLATTITVDGVDANHAFPTGGGYIMIESEVILYTAFDGTDFTGCTRGGGKGTTAVSHADNSSVGLALTETTFSPYTTAECLYYGALLEKTRKLYATGGGNVYDESILSRGNVAKSFSLEFAEGGVAQGTIGTIQGDWANNFDANAVTSAASAKATLKWQDAYVYFMDDTATPAGGTHKVWIQSLSLNCTNNATAHFYNSNSVKNFTLGDLMITGNLQMPWVANAERSEYYFAQVDAFRNGTKKRIIIGWGHEGNADLSELGRADNGMLIDMYIQYTGAERGGDNQIISDMEYKNILPEGKTYSIQFKTYTYVGSLDRGLPPTV